MSEGASVLRPRVCVATPTRNRKTLLQRLHNSLVAQSEHDFTWVVVDDGGDDGSLEWLRAQSLSSPFALQVLVNSQNLGKAASLNRVFDEVTADFYLVVDSDDRLLPDAIETVSKRVRDQVGMTNIGAIFFSYRDHAAKSLGGPPGGRDAAMFRSVIDGTHGKYDGCVGYFGRAVAQHRYPKFPGETYMGPTVLQLLMEPDFKILFVPDVIGVAEYQEGGLTASGRTLRLKNPLGMMTYSSLCAERGITRRMRLKYRVSYWAYSYVAGRNYSKMRSLNPPEPPTRRLVERLLGRFLAARWVKASGQR